MLRKIVVFDTNVCQNIIAGFPDRWQSVLSAIGRQFQIKVSPHTFWELLDAITNGSEESLTRYQDRVRVMSGSGKPKFLLTGPSFALKYILRKDYPNDETAVKELQEAFTVVLKARTRSELMQSGVKLDLRRCRTALALERITEKSTGSRNEHKNMLKAIRSGKHPVSPSAQEWARELANELSPHIDDRNAALLVNGLSAARLWDEAVRNKALDRQYNIDGEKHRGDFTDIQQLMYLCNPHISLVTCEEKMKTLCARSPQSDRILLYNDFIRGLSV